MLTQHIQLTLSRDGSYQVAEGYRSAPSLGYCADFLCTELQEYEQTLSFLDYLFVSQLGNTLGGDRMLVQIQGECAYVGYDDDPYFQARGKYTLCSSESFEQMLRDWLRVLEMQPQQVTLMQEGIQIQLLI